MHTYALNGVHSPAVAVPAAVLAAILFACFIFPHVWTLPEPVGGSALDANRGMFTPGHILGTDLNGNDILSRLLHGGQTSFVIAFAVNAIGLVVGGTMGAVAGYARAIDAVVMRVLDVFVAFPSLILVIAFSHAMGPSKASSVWALSLYSVPTFARVARAAALRLRQSLFIIAAELAGTSHVRMLVHHVARNIGPQLLELAFLGMGIVIVLEGTLSFLGLGIQAPIPTWGNMIAEGQRAMFTKPSLVLLPSVCLFLTVLSLNLLGRAVQLKRMV